MPGIARDFHACVAQHLRHQAVEILTLVAVTWQRREIRALLEQQAQRIVRLEVAGLDDHPPFELAIGQQRLERGGGDPAAGGCAHHLAAAEHRDRSQLQRQSVGLGLELGILDAYDLAGRVAGLLEAFADIAGAFRHQPLIRSVDQNGLDGRRDRLDELPDLVGLDANHQAGGRERKIETRAAISVPTALAARFSASSRARTLA